MWEIENRKSVRKEKHFHVSEEKQELLRGAKGRARKREHVHFSVEFAELR